MYVCMYVCVELYLLIGYLRRKNMYYVLCMYVCMYVNLFVCIYECIYVACMYVCMYVGYLFEFLAASQ